MDFDALILERLSQLGENVNSFEAKQGWAQGYLRAVVRNDDKRSRPNIDRAKVIAEALGLEFYIGPPRERGPVYTTRIDHQDFAAIPRLDARLAAGGGAENDPAETLGALAFRRDWLRDRGISPDRSCLLRVTGDSMAPTLRDGDLVMIDERRTEIRGRRVYAVIDTDGAARVKRLEARHDAYILLTSDNPDHVSELRTGPEMNDLRILGEIVWSARVW